MERARTASVKSTDPEESGEARHGLDCHLQPHGGHRSRGWLLSTPSSLARAQAGGSGTFRKNPNRFPLEDTASTIVGEKLQMIERHEVVAGYPAIHTKKRGCGSVREAEVRFVPTGPPNWTMIRHPKQR